MSYKKDRANTSVWKDGNDAALESSLISGRKNMEKELRSRTAKTRSVIWN